MKFKWGTENTFQMLLFPVLGNISKYLTAKFINALGTPGQMVLCGRGNRGAYQCQSGLERGSILV